MGVDLQPLPQVMVIQDLLFYYMLDVVTIKGWRIKFQLKQNNKIVSLLLKCIKFLFWKIKLAFDCLLETLIFCMMNDFARLHGEVESHNPYR